MDALFQRNSRHFAGQGCVVRHIVQIPQFAFTKSMRRFAAGLGAKYRHLREGAIAKSGQRAARRIVDRGSGGKFAETKRASRSRADADGGVFTQYRLRPGVESPQGWWPVGMGEHPLYRLQLAALVDGAMSDQTSTTFGIRNVTSRLTKQSHRQFVVNGKPLLIRGGGWACDRGADGWIPSTWKRRSAIYVGLDTIRSEGKLEDQRFYDLADQLGVMILSWLGSAATNGKRGPLRPGQTLGTTPISKWPKPPMASEARLLRFNPSVIGFLNQQRQRAGRLRSRRRLRRHPARGGLADADRRRCFRV